MSFPSSERRQQAKETRRAQLRTVEGRDLPVEALQRGHEVAAHSAADAAVDDLDHLLVDVLAEDLLVDADLPQLVLDHREAQAVGSVPQDVVEEGRLPGPEEAGQHCEWEGTWQSVSEWSERVWQGATTLRAYRSPGRASAASGTPRFSRRLGSSSAFGLGLGATWFGVWKCL